MHGKSTRPSDHWQGAVCLYRFIPHPVAGIDRRIKHFSGRAGIALADHQERCLLLPCAVLDKNILAQSLRGRGHRHTIGVSVRNQLERVFQVRRRHIWPSSGIRGHNRLHAGGELSLHDGFRLAKGYRAGCTFFLLRWWPWGRAFRYSGS